MTAAEPAARPHLLPRRSHSVCTCCQIRECVRVCTQRKPKAKTKWTAREQQQQQQRRHWQRQQQRQRHQQRLCRSCCVRVCVCVLCPCSGCCCCCSAAAAHLLTLTAAHRAFAACVSLPLLAQRQLRLLSFCEQRRVSMCASVCVCALRVCPSTGVGRLVCVCVLCSTCGMWHVSVSLSVCRCFDCVSLPRRASPHLAFHSCIHSLRSREAANKKQQQKKYNNNKSFCMRFKESERGERERVCVCVGRVWKRIEKRDCLTMAAIGLLSHTLELHRNLFSDGTNF